MLTSQRTRSLETGLISVSLRRILPDADFLNCRDLWISEFATNPRHVQPGQVYVVAKEDGEDEVATALERGASGIICDRTFEAPGVCRVMVADVRVALGQIAHALAGDPSRSLPCIGVYGSESAAFLNAILEADGRQIGFAEHGATRSAEMVAEIAGSMVARGCELGIFEFTAQELESRALSGMVLDASLVITDQSRDEPVSSLSRLVRAVRPEGFLAIRGDDPRADLLAASNPMVRVVAFEFQADGEIHGIIENSREAEMTIRLFGLDRERLVRLNAVETATAFSAIGAAAVARQYGASDGAIVAGLESVSQFPARIQSPAAGRHSFALEPVQRQSHADVRKIA